MKYTINISIEPKNKYLKASVKISSLPNKKNLNFWLNKSFSITSFASSNNVTFTFDKMGESAPYTDNSSFPICIHNTDEWIMLEYEGKIENIISKVNMINDDLVELGLYSCWYPYLPNTPFEYECFVTLPSEYIFISEGTITKTCDNKTNQFHVTSDNEMYDILIIASPQFTNTLIEYENKKISLYHTKSFNLGNRVQNLKNAYETTLSLLGKPEFSKDIVYIYSPREGWGYMRDIIVVSEKTVNEHDEIHELIHTWWRIAINNGNDWINEGLAEYFTFFTQKNIDSSIIKDTINDFIKHIGDTQKAVSIIETQPTSPDRYVNLYEKTTILFYGAEIKFGENKLMEALREFYNTFKISTNATTEGFLNIINEIMGADSYNYFKYYLNLNDWTNIDIQKEILK